MSITYVYVDYWPKIYLFLYPSLGNVTTHIAMKSVNLKYITVGRLDDDLMVPPSDGAMFILID